MPFSLDSLSLLLKGEPFVVGVQRGCEFHSSTFPSHCESAKGTSEISNEPEWWSLIIVA